MPPRVRLWNAPCNAPQDRRTAGRCCRSFIKKHRARFQPEPDSLIRAFSAAQAALQADATNHLCHHALAAALFFRGDIPAFRAAAERAITLNPMDGSTVASLGFLLADSG